MLVPLGGFYLDSVADSAATARPTVINRIPEPNEDGVPEADAIYLTVVDVGAAGLVAAGTTITIDSDAGTIVVWDGAAFHASWSASTFLAARSDGVGPDDEHRFVLRRATAFGSLETVTVTLHAETIDAEVLDTSWQFTVRDFTAPAVTAVRSNGLRQLLVTFSEAVEQGTNVAGDALRVRPVSSIELIAPADLTTTIDTFAAADVGLYIGIAGAEQPVNNKQYRINSVANARRVTLDADVVDEVTPGTTIATVGPYGLEGVPDADQVLPVFTPVILSAEPGLTLDTVVLNLHAELSAEREYKFSTHQVDDLYDNRVLNDDPPFTAEPLPAPPGRKFDLLESIPQHNLREDESRDLERFIRCIQEVSSLLLYDVDKFAEIVDVDLAPEGALDVLLDHLGNPFRFVVGLSAAQKRALIDVLVQIYKRNGTELGMEAVINFFIGVPVDIRPYQLGEVWSLGEDLLDEGTVLGPGTTFLLYAFEAVSPEALTSTQRDILREIANYMKPAHTHFVRIVEP